MQNCNTVRRRALNYLTTLKEMGYSNELPLDQARDLFSRILDVWDRTTLKAYFGVKAHMTKRLVQRTAIYRSTCTISNKDVYLSEKFETCPGYLEKMGLVTYSLKGKVWFMKIETAFLVPQLAKADSKGSVSINNFSLSPINVKENTIPISQGESARENRFEKVVSLDGAVYNELETTQQLQNEREKTSSVKPEKYTLQEES